MRALADSTTLELLARLATTGSLYETEAIADVPTLDWDSEK